MPPNVPPPPPDAAGDDEDIIELTEIVEKGTLGDAEDDDLFSLDDNDVDISFEQELEELFSDDDEAGSTISADTDMDQTTEIPPEGRAEADDLDFGVDDDTVDETSGMDFGAAMDELSADDLGGMGDADEGDDQEIDLDATLAFDEDFEAKLGLGSDDSDDNELDLDAALAGLEQQEQAPSPPVEDSGLDGLDGLDLDSTLAMTDDLAQELAGGGLEFDLDQDAEMATTVREDGEERDLLAEVDDAGDIDLGMGLDEAMDEPVEQSLEDSLPDDLKDDLGGAIGGIGAKRITDDDDDDSGPGIPDLDQLTNLGGEGEFTLEIHEDEPDAGLGGGLDLTFGPSDEDVDGIVDIPLGMDVDVDSGPELIVPDAFDEDEGVDLLAAVNMDDDEDEAEDGGDMGRDVDAGPDSDEDEGDDILVDTDQDGYDMDIPEQDEFQPQFEVDDDDEEMKFAEDDEDIDISELDELIDELDLPDTGDGSLESIRPGAAQAGGEEPVTQTEVESLLQERKAMQAAASADLSAVMERLEALEVKLETVGQGMDQRIQEALAEGSPLMERIAQSLGREMGAIVQEAVNSLEERIVTQQEYEAAMDAFREELAALVDKAVPEAAARIIREEISALAQEL